MVYCDTQEEIDHYWNSLTADGGNESMCGWLKDKYGVSWQIVPSVMGKLMSDPNKFQRVIEKVMQMKKLIIADMENA
jgi:predicted 3-demethylubiquinone-9 3-methyltransferase (glyoxalase superfamily)